MQGKPVAIDLFAGVGGLSLGFEAAGFDVRVAVESDNAAAETYGLNFPQTKVIPNKIEGISGELIRAVGEIEGGVEVVFGGPPCQGVSTGGKRLLEDPRNALFLEFARIVKELQPKYFVLENVQGLLQGRMRSLLDGFISSVEADYYQVIKPVQVLNAADFGVPQRRNRVFVIGYKRGTPEPGYPVRPYAPRISVWDAISDLPEPGMIGDSSGVFYGELGQPTPYSSLLSSLLKVWHFSRETPFGIDGFQITEHSAKTVKRFGLVKPGTFDKVSRFYRLHKDGISSTLRAGTGPDKGSFMAPRPIHPSTDRCITVREAARLQSFPDWFQFHETKWHSFLQIGNAVPPLLARAVAEPLYMQVTK